MSDALINSQTQRQWCYRALTAEARIEELEAKLERAVELALTECPFQFGTPNHKDWWSIRRTNLEELTGQDDE